MCRFASAKYEQICANCWRLKNRSRWESKKEAVMKSWIAAITGSPFRGVTRLSLMFMRVKASVLASSVCGTSVGSEVNGRDVSCLRKITHGYSFRHRRNQHHRVHRHTRSSETIAMASL